MLADDCNLSEETESRPLPPALEVMRSFINPIHILLIYDLAPGVV